MKKSEIEVGEVYTLKHHDGNIITARVERKFGHQYSTTKWFPSSPRREYYDCTNLHTGRAIVVKSAAKFRKRVPSAPGAPPSASSAVAPKRDPVGVRPPYDATVADHGSIAILAPLSAAVLAHLREHTGEETQWWGNPDNLDGTSGLVVESRYVADVVHGLRAEGFTVK